MNKPPAQNDHHEFHNSKMIDLWLDGSLSSRNIEIAIGARINDE